MPITSVEFCQLLSKSSIFILLLNAHNFCFILVGLVWLVCSVMLEGYDLSSKWIQNAWYLNISFRNVHTYSASLLLNRSLNWKSTRLWKSGCFFVKNAIQSRLYVEKKILFYFIIPKFHIWFVIWRVLSPKNTKGSFGSSLLETFITRKLTCNAQMKWSTRIILKYVLLMFGGFFSIPSNCPMGPRLTQNNSFRWSAQDLAMPITPILLLSFPFAILIIHREVSRWDGKKYPLLILILSSWNKKISNDILLIIFPPETFQLTTCFQIMTLFYPSNC